MNLAIVITSAPVVSVITAALEAIPGIPYFAKSKASVIACLLGVSLAIRVATAFASGTLNIMDLKYDIELFAEAALTAAAAAGGYSLVKSEKPVV